MKSFVALLAMGTLLVGCGPDPQTATKLKELEERLAKMEEGQKAGPQVPGRGKKAEPIDREMEQAAAAMFKEANAAFEAGNYDEARAKIAKLEAEFPKARATRAAKRTQAELEVIGKDAGTMETEKWFQGETTYADGKATLLVFWEVWCPHCKREVPKIQSTYDKYKGQGLNIVGLTKMTRNITEDQVTEFLSSNNVSYPVAKEDGQKMSDRFGVKGIPAAAVVKDGKVVWRGHPARIKDEMIAGWLE